MSERYICNSKFYVCYHCLRYENPGRKILLTRSVQSIIIKLIDIKIDIIIIFTLLFGASDRFHLYEAPKRSVGIKNLCHFPPLFHWDNKG